MRVTAPYTNQQMGAIDAMVLSMLELGILQLDIGTYYDPELLMMDPTKETWSIKAYYHGAWLTLIKVVYDPIDAMAADIMNDNGEQHV